MEPDERLLTIQQVSEMFGLKLTTMYKLVREKKVPGVKVGKHWRFRREAIDQFLEDQQQL